MSTKTRFVAAILATTLLAGTASFAISEPRSARRIDIEESRSFLGEMFGWVRELLGERRASKEGSRGSETSSTSKDGSGADPNGGK